jgi:hypothetical protein
MTQQNLHQDAAKSPSRRSKIFFSMQNKIAKSVITLSVAV